MRVLRAGEREDSAGKVALCEARRLSVRFAESLLHIRLITGRTHQIRVQLAARGFPIVGDVKYGARPHPDGLHLHAFRIILPEGEFVLTPPWLREEDACLI